MQTFLPFPDFFESAKVLDYRRLGKQRVETYQILLILTGKSERRGWANHPAVKMWNGFVPALAGYGVAICDEWIRRGYRDTLLEKILQVAGTLTCSEDKLPKWFGDTWFHASHRSNLLRKDPVFYGKYGWGEPNDLEYVWPVV